MKPKRRIIFRGPVLTASGYGVHARMILRPLLESGEYDISVISTNWGVTPMIRTSDPFLDRVRTLSMMNPHGDYDISIQVTIPQEFQRMARFNIGVTAGIETDRVSAKWITTANQNADLIIVPSQHAKETFTNTTYTDQAGNYVKLTVPTVVLFEGVDTTIYNTNPVTSNVRQFDFDADFNFISVGLGFDKGMGEDRKNLTTLVKWFCEQFKGNKNVGLVLKSSIVGYSSIDLKFLKTKIEGIKREVGCGEYPKIQLIHGFLSSEEMAALYKNPKVKAYITLTHGEGYGLPIIEAAACGLPVIATDWSGHLDFLQINGVRKFVAIPHDLKEIPDVCVWDDILVKGSRWAYPDEIKSKMLMSKVQLSYSKPKAWADELAEHIASKFSIEGMEDKLHNIMASDPTLQLERKIDGKKLSGYTTVLNAESMGYPYIECIKSMLGFCDEVVVVDGGSTDGTVDKINALGDERINLISRPWNPEDGAMAIDGEQKQFARMQCTGDFLWQQDADEVVHEEDYQKIRSMVDDFPVDVDVIHLPVIELWAGVENVRCDRHTWKWRLSRNNPFIVHGVNKHARVFKNGKLLARKGMSDSCEYIDSQSGEFVSHRGHYTSETEVVRRINPELYAKISNDDFKKYPSIFHYSLANIPRKIKNYKDFWSKFWVSMYDEEKPEQIYFKGKNLNDVTDADIVEEAKKVIAQGDPELAFYKHSVDVHGRQYNGKVPLFKLERTHPEVMGAWIERCNKDMEDCK
jgi:glycosyltransferase involved in cell wall biosynthesis